MANSIYEAFAQTVDRWPQRDMLQVLPATANVYDIEAGTLSYRHVHEQVISYSHRFEGAGYTQGMRVALLLENRPVFFLIWLALNRLGVSVVPINPDLRTNELSYLLSHAEPALVISISSRLIDLSKAVKQARFAVQVICVDDPLPSPREDSIVAEPLSGGEQEAAVLYTSGTTGNPKGCVLPNNYFLLAGQWYANVGGLASLDNNGERMITPLPVFHMNAMAYSFMAMVTIGGCLCVLDRFHPGSWWSSVRASDATCLHYLGVMPTLLMNAPVSPDDQNHCVKFGFGAGIDPELHEAFETRFGFPLVEAWAMTETGAGAVVAASDKQRIVGQSCLGRPQPSIDCKLVDTNGLPVSTDQPGELLVRHKGSNLRFGFFSKYYKNKKATEDAWRDEWFHTGDIVKQDAAGNLYFVDRKKNVIRRSGENIAAIEVESVLMRHPAVSAAAVTAVPDPLRGDEVFACLKVDKPSTSLANDITQWCLSELAYYKAPGYIAFVDSLPLTATQKVQRATLKAQAAQLLDDPATVNTTSLKRRQVAI
ncbi:MAG: AMP-binding protein [Granulosicoccus sp.]